MSRRATCSWRCRASSATVWSSCRTRSRVAPSRSPPSAAVPSDVPSVLRANARHALADLSAAFYGHPSRALAGGRHHRHGRQDLDDPPAQRHPRSARPAHGLADDRQHHASASEVRPNAADHTTPEAPIVQRTLAEMRAARLRRRHRRDQLARAGASIACAGSISSVGVFTNLSPEHINFHGSFEAYLAAKRKLFERLPADRPGGPECRRSQRRRHARGHARAGADVRPRPPRRLHGPRPPADLARHVVRPAAWRSASRTRGWSAASTSPTGWPRTPRRPCFGATPDDLVRAAAAQPPVPGRMNLVEARPAIRRRRRLCSYAAGARKGARHRPLAGARRNSCWPSDWRAAVTTPIDR